MTTRIGHNTGITGGLKVPNNRVPKSPLSPHDAKAASHLKASVLSASRSLEPLTGAKPTLDSHDHWLAPGTKNRLVPVTLTSTGGGATQPMASIGLVDPKTNTFFRMNTGGFVGILFYGPGTLKAADQFTGKKFSKTAYDTMEALANGAR